MNWQAIGMNTKIIYVTGTHAECVRKVNERIGKQSIHYDKERKEAPIAHKEPIRIVPEGTKLLTDAEYLENYEKEMTLLKLQSQEEEDVAYQAAKSARLEACDEKRRLERAIAEKKMEAVRLARANRKKREGTKKPIHYWTEEELEILTALNGKVSSEEIAAEIKAKTGSIRAFYSIDSQLTKMRSLGLLPKANHKKFFTPESVAIVVDNYGKIPVREIAKLIGTTSEKVSSKIGNLKRLGIL